MSEDEVSEMFGGDDSPFSDFFRTFFGGDGRRDGQRRARPRPRTAHAKGRDVEHEIELDLEDALHGTVQRLGIKHDGAAAQRRGAHSGRRHRGLARACGRRRRARQRQRPAAATSTCASSCGRIARFDRKGRDLYTKVRVPPTTAVLGGEVDVPDTRRQIAAAEDSARHAERPGVPPARPRIADDRQGRPARRSVCHGRRHRAADADGRGTEALRSARRAGEDAS